MASPSTASLSPAAETVTGWVVLQLLFVKVSEDPPVMLKLPSPPDTFAADTVTFADGCVASRTVKVAVLPSLTDKSVTESVRAFALGERASDCGDAAELPVAFFARSLN